MTSSPWGSSVHSSVCYRSTGPSQSQRLSLPPHLPSMPGLPNLNFPIPPPPSGNLLASPLPTALFPLPLDPLCPPAVLPPFHNHTNQSSGYSTAGHSRSSSPMVGGGGEQAKGNGSRNGSPSSPSPLQPPFPSPSPNIVFEAPSTEITLLSHFPTVPGQFVVYFHINPGLSVGFNVGGDQLQVIKGPMTVPLVSTNSTPPMPLPMQVPPGHVVQQIVDESGTLRHVIVSHQPPLIPIPQYGPGNQSQPYFGAGPGFPPFGSIQGPCGMNSSQGGPTPPPGGGLMSYVQGSQKDERAQRQFLKLRRKFEQKHQSNHFHQNNGPFRKDGGYNNNGSRRNVANGLSKEEDGSVGSTGSVTSTGTQDEEEETRLQAQQDMLSAILPPTVSEVSCRSAFIKWGVPERWTESGENKYLEVDVSDSDFRYEVFISDRSKDSRFKSIFLGTALSCRVKDLKPATPYAIAYCASVLETKGPLSPPTLFTTLPAEPEAPQSPRAISRNRNSLAFKWTAPPDNGAKLLAYLLEYDDGKGGANFIEAYRGKAKTCTVSKLQPAYSYQFRLAAINEVGQSRFSATTTVMTAGSPPPQPLPPTLSEAGVTFLRLEWKGRPSDEEYSLQMEDPSSGHGYLGAYSGTTPHATCIGLNRATDYKFRLKAYNAEGHSKWSEEVVFRTLPDRPGPPQKPILKGRPLSSSFKLKWDPPQDNGGVGLRGYYLEIDQGEGRWEEVYRGSDREWVVEGLSPGESYALRLRAFGPGGQSDPSEVSVFTTEPVCPAKCHIPRIVGKPKSSSVHLKWSSPDWDGGSPLTSFEVGSTTPDNRTQEAYRGKDTSCFVTGLLPGRAYLFQVRAVNRMGPGPWSDPLEVVSGPGSPDRPIEPTVSTKSSHSVLVSWTEPLNNGSAVSDYRLQMASLQTPDHSDHNHDIQTETESAVEPVFSLVYQGPLTSYELKALQPGNIYLFRLQACNSAGSSEWSGVRTHEMGASSPNTVTGIEASATSSSISLSWAIPASNGSPITNYNLLLGDTLLSSPSNDLLIQNLMPHTQHKIRIQAVNSIGRGSFSPLIKVWTKGLPPMAPKLELVGSAHFWLKLKWVGEKGVEYVLQMVNPCQEDFQVVYRGTQTSAKVSRLSEDTLYQFRISGINAAGQGLFSDLFKFSTLKAPPAQVKGLKVTCGKEGLRFDWATLSTPPLLYHLQVAKKRDQEFRTIYRGEETVFDKFQDLDPGAEYLSRVCAVRRLSEGGELVGPYSFTLPFSTPAPPSENVCLEKAESSSFTSNLSTTAAVLEERLKSISYESKVGLLAVVALVFLAFLISLITHQVVS